MLQATLQLSDLWLKLLVSIGGGLTSKFRAPVRIRLLQNPTVLIQ